MAPSTSTLSPWTRFLSTIVLLQGLLVMPTAADQYLQQTYCSNQNTGSGDLANTTIYQSLGNCQGLCRGSYAYGIVLGKDCWCSNTAPTDQESISKCSDACFGYPYESCGNAGSGLYGYISGSAVAGQQSVLPLPSSSSSGIASQSLRTSGGVVYTATVTVAPTSAPETLQAQSKGISGGSIAGIVIGVIAAAVLLLAAIIVALMWRRRRRDEADDEGGLNRNTSVLSRGRLLGGSRGTSGDPYAPANNPGMQERRNSKPLVTDQRLNPNAFMQHEDGSRSSFVSMQDNRDYTRTLNVRNPDPHPR